MFVRIEIELIRVKPYNLEDMNVWDMNDQERLECAMSKKSEADSNFKSGKLDVALELYENSLKIILDDESEV